MVRQRRDDRKHGILGTRLQAPQSSGVQMGTLLQPLESSATTQSQPFRLLQSNLNSTARRGHSDVENALKNFYHEHGHGPFERLMCVWLLNSVGELLAQVPPKLLNAQMCDMNFLRVITFHYDTQSKCQVSEAETIPTSATLLY